MDSKKDSDAIDPSLESTQKESRKVADQTVKPEVSYFNAPTTKTFLSAGDE